MTDPNPATLFGRVTVEELARLEVDVAFAPGSRSTPLVVAAHRHPDVETFSHLDERSAAFFALGRGRRTGRPTAVVCTSGTAAANFHPAVVEADTGRVPLVVLTADRPPELADSGANQTVDQEKLYGDAVRTYRDLPEPEADPRTVRSLRTTVARAVADARSPPAGPVHLNARLRKPLEPTPTGDVPADFDQRSPLAAAGRPGAPFVRTAVGTARADPATVDRLAGALRTGRALVVAGPADPVTADSGDAGDDGDGSSTGTDTAGSEPASDPDGRADSRPGYPGVAALARATGHPLLADPLSGLRFHPAVDGELLVCGGYDTYLGPETEWPDPDVVFRVGASPTSKPLRNYLRSVDARQFVVDPAGGWREAEFTATDLVVADPDALARTLARRIASGGDAGSGGDEDSPAGGDDPDDGTDGLADDADGPAGRPADPDWRGRFRVAERIHREVVGKARTENDFEGAVLATVAAETPAPATVFVSNSTPVRDLDRFGAPRGADLAVLGNRGASGIDGITSTALGAGSTVADPAVLVTGDLAYYHDSNGLLALSRLDVDATVVLINNDGGGIFHTLPIEEYDPPFTEAFKTPHGLDFAPTGDLYGFDYRRVDPGDFADAYRRAVGDGTTVIEVRSDAADSHRTRERIRERVRDRIRERLPAALDDTGDGGDSNSDDPE